MQDSSRPIWFKKENHSIGMKVGQPETRIYVATPVHSECSIHYTQALLKFQQACMMNNIMVSFSLLKSSLVTQGRNLCVANFLSDPGNYTHMLFIDSDIDFKFETIMKMLKLDKEVIATPYPMKHIHWEQIWDRLQKGKIKNKDELMRSGFIYPIKMEGLMDDVKKEISIVDGLMEVSHAPTGCMLIKRQVFDKMIKAYPNDFIDQATIVNGEAKTNPYMYNFFDTVHDQASKKYYGEDFGFCRKWTAIGGKCYCLIDEYITHVGEYQYNGRLKDNLEMVNTVDDSLKNK
jgi:hypothetical protein